MYKNILKIDAEMSLNADKLLNTTTEDMEYVLKHFGISEKALEEMIRGIYDWYDKQPHFPKGELHDQTILRHLITRGFSVESVKQKIDNFYTAKHQMPELLSGRDPLSPQLHKYLKQGYWIILPKMTPDKCRVTIFRIKERDDYSVMNLAKLIFMMSEYRIWNDSALAEHIIFDLSNITFHLVAQCTPMLIAKCVFYATSCLGPKIKGIHLVHMPSYAETGLMLFKKAMKAKLAQRIHLYNNFEELMTKFPKSMFPVEFGGDGRSCREIAIDWMEMLTSSTWRDYYIKQDKIHTDESKREASNKGNEIFGVEGSFRKLDLD